MRTILFSIMFTCIASFAFGQVCTNNPSVQQGDIDPAPLYPGAVGIAKFSYFENLLDYTAWANDPVTLTFCLLHIEPLNGASSISGSASSWFTWSYDPVTNCLLGTQNQSILGGTGGLIALDFQVKNMINCPNNQTGFTLNLQPAACMNGSNLTTDDTESIYTCFDPNGGTSSIEEERLGLGFNLFPNPASKHMTLEINSLLPSQNADLVITDMLGRTPKTIKNKTIIKGENSYKINIKSLVNGSYFLTVNSEDGTQATLKFIKAVE